jgi:hypothetical protein
MNDIAIEQTVYNIYVLSWIQKRRIKKNEEILERNDK